MPKRKRGIAPSTAAPAPASRGSKRTKRLSAAYAPAQSTLPHPHGAVDYEKDYKLRAIIGETKTQYYIDWEDDSETGEAYNPTWEPKANANDLAVADWQARKTTRTPPHSKKKGRSSKRAAGSSPASAKKPRRPKRVIESSSDDVPPPPSGTRPVETEPEPEIEESVSQDDDDSLLSAPAYVPLTDGRQIAVQLSDPPSSYQAGAYERIPERHNLSLESSTSLLDTTTPPQSTQLTGEQSNSLVIPDSQSQQQVREITSFGSSPTSESRVALFTQEPLFWAANTTQAGLAIEGASSKDFADTADTAPKETLSQPDQPVATETTATKLQAPADTVSEDPVVSQPIQPAATKTTESDETPTALEQERATSLSQGDVSQSDQSIRNEAYTSSNEQPPKQQEEVQQAEGGASERSDLLQENQNNTQKPLPSSSEKGQRRDPPSASENNRDCIVISSENEHGQNSSNDRSYNPTDFLSQAQYSPLPGAQRPLPPSVVNSSSETKGQPQTSQRLIGHSSCHINGHSLQAIAAQSSLAIQTRLDLPTSAVHVIECQSLATTSQRGRVADFAPPLQPTGVRPPSATSTRSFDSTFPSLPSQTLDAIGESAPSRLRTPTPSQPPITSPNKFEMDSSMASKPATPSLSSQLKARREGRRQARRSQTPAVTNNAQPVSSLPPNINAEVAAARAASPGLLVPDDVRSPSAVPAVEPESPVTREEMNTSERYETLLPQSQNYGLDHQDESRARALTVSNTATVPVPEDPNEDPEIANMHVVPVPFNGPQRDSYAINVGCHNEVIERFLAQRHPADELLEEAENLLQRLHNLATHPDLTNPETLSQASEPDRQAQWDYDSSGKFCFLRELFDALLALSQTTHVAVAARGDRVPDMLETFCNGWKIAYSRSGVQHPFSRPGQEKEKEKLHVTILDLDHDSEMPRDADIVIALDGTIDYRHRVIRAARLHTKGEGMTGTNSWAMLLTLVVPKTVEHIERCLASNLSPAVRARVLVTTARKLQHEACKKEHDGQDYAKDAAKKVVEYLNNPEATEWPLGVLSQIQDLDSQTETELEPSRTYFSSSATEGGHSIKRARLSDDPAHMEVTHVSGSLGKTTQPSLDEIFAPPSGPSMREQQLRAEVNRLQGRLDDLVNDLERVQFQCEAQRAELIQKIRELEEAVSHTQTALNRTATVEIKYSTVKSENTELQKQLTEANAKLLDHSVPGRAEMESLRLELEAIKVAKGKSDKVIDRLQTNEEWLRSVYQESSNKVRGLQLDNNDLQTRLASAEKYASGETARARQISKDCHDKKLGRENLKLRAMVKDSRAGLKSRDEEITRLKKEATRGRVGKRQSSVPRSPRRGSPMRLAGGRGSRQASPATGEARGKGAHPLRKSAGS